MQGIDAQLFGVLIAQTLKMATPLILAALGGMFSEKSGVVNIGLEGMMLVGAFSAAVATYFTNNPWFGLLVGMLGGAALALLHAIVCVKFKGDHIVSGTGIILLGAGITTIGLDLVWGNTGQSDQVTLLPNVNIPQLEGIPVIGSIFGTLSPIIYLMFGIVIVCWYVLYRTPIGLRIRAAGEDPSTLDTAGINVENIRILAVILSGVLAGLAGAYLSISFEAAFSRGMTSGRGFIALAAMIFGNWTPVGCLIAGLFFGFLASLEIVLQVVLGVGIVTQYGHFIQMIPFVLVIVAIAGIRKSVPPKGIAVPYEKEKRA